MIHPQEHAKAAGSSVDRRHSRHHLALPLNLWRSAGSATMIPGIALEISESGISVILPEQLQIGETVELAISLPGGPLRAAAVVRNQAMFRYGFEFAFLTSAQLQLIKETCASLPLYTDAEH